MRYGQVMFLSLPLPARRGRARLCVRTCLPGVAKRTERTEAADPQASGG
jgi:hypothetical protein